MITTTVTAVVIIYLSSTDELTLPFPPSLPLSLALPSLSINMYIQYTYIYREPHLSRIHFATIIEIVDNQLQLSTRHSCLTATIDDLIDYCFDTIRWTLPERVSAHAPQFSWSPSAYFLSMLCMD
jgi:hypothetical protein